MAANSPEQTRILARLAKLQLEDAEIVEYGRQLADILGYIESLAAVDTTGVEAHVGASPADSSLRDDVVVDRDGRAHEELIAEILESVPSLRDTQVVVPKIKDAD